MSNSSFFEIKYLSKEPKETLALGEKLGHLLFPGAIVLLNGDLGAGKTLFCGGLAKGLGIEEAITSPTFNILKVYEEGRLPFYHIDAYRLNQGSADIGLEDYLFGDGVSAVEWPEFIASYIPENHLEISIDPTGEETRDFLLVAKGEKYFEVLKKLEASL